MIVDGNAINQTSLRKCGAWKHFNDMRKMIEPARIFS